MLNLLFPSGHVPIKHLLHGTNWFNVMPVGSIPLLLRTNRQMWSAGVENEQSSVTSPANWRRLTNTYISVPPGKSSKLKTHSHVQKDSLGAPNSTWNQTDFQLCSPSQSPSRITSQRHSLSFVKVDKTRGSAYKQLTTQKENKKLHSS